MADKNSKNGWRKVPSSELVEHIVNTHHQFLKRELPLLEKMLEGLIDKTERQDVKLREAVIVPVLRVFRDLRQELEQHMHKEECILFPYIRQLDAFRSGDGPPPCIPCGSSAGPIHQMEVEHESATKALEEIRALTQNYQVAQSGHGLVESCFRKLHDLDADLMEHIALENDILFPCTESMEKESFGDKHFSMKTPAKALAVLFFLSTFLVSGLSQAQTLEERVLRLEEENKTLKGKMSDLEGIEKPEQKGSDATANLLAIHKRIQPFGEIGFRYHGLFFMENIQSRGVNFSHIDALFSQPENRIRVGLKGEVIDGLSYEVRLGTGPATFPSGAWPPVTVDGYFGKLGLNLDRYYLNWRPAFYKPVHVLAGKFQDPMQGTELVWDSDVGLFGSYAEIDLASASSLNRLFERLAFGGLFYHLSTQTADANDDVYVTGGALQSKVALGEQVDFGFHVAYYDYHNVNAIAQTIGAGRLLTPRGSPFLTPGQTTNLTPVGPVRPGAATATTLTTIGYASDFNILNPYFEIKTRLKDVPIKVHHDMVWNAGAKGVGEDFDLGFRSGLTIGGPGDAGSLWFGYEYFLIEADATLEAFTEDALATNVTGHLVKGGVSLAKNVDLFATVQFFRDLNPQFSGFGDDLGAAIPGVLVPIDEAHWMVRPRVFLVCKF